MHDDGAESRFSAGRAGAGPEPGPFGPRGPGWALLSGVRWATLGLAVVLATVRGLGSAETLVWMLLLVLHAVWRTRRREDARLPACTLVLVELCLDTLAVATTGTWGSPFVYCLVTPVIAAGFDLGLARSLRTAVTIVTTIGLEASLAAPLSLALQATGQWSIELLLVAVLASYARQMFGEAQERHSLALDRMSQLTEANDLLVSLHRVAQSLPATLNLDEVLASTLTRLRAMIRCDVAAVLMLDETSSCWRVVGGEGTRLAGPMPQAGLPPALLAASQSSVASLVVVLAPGEGIGVELLSRSGLYAPLRARGRLVGLVALEHHEPGQYGRRELRLLDGFIDTAALAIDNARWFARLRAMGADEERTRIARDMHDRIGQSLASLAFKLDRITTRAQASPLGDELDQLRAEVRGVLGDVRATLSDLRTDVSDVRGLAETLGAFLDRVAARASLSVSYVRDEAWRLPLVQERELWRIAHEAIVNVERHAAAGALDVRWHCDGLEALLVVSDDGHGFGIGGSRPESFGITGMRERADAIGATLDIVSWPQGTTVTCRLSAVSITAKVATPRARERSAPPA